MTSTEITLTLPVLVGVNTRDVYEVRVPGIASKVCRGTSLAEVLDDSAMHLMETVPQLSPDQMSRFTLCPYVEHKRLRVEVNLKYGDSKRATAFKGRLSVVLWRWPDESFRVACIPRLEDHCFAVAPNTRVHDALVDYLKDWARRGNAGALTQATCQRDEHLELLEVEVERPTRLPSRPKKRKRVKRVGEATEKAPKKKKKRIVLPPTTLRKVGINLLHRARDGRLIGAHGRDAIVEEVLRQIRAPSAAVLLVGPRGVGKTAVIHEVVKRLAAEELSIATRTDVWAVDGNRIISGMSYVGQWEKRCDAMIEELEARQDVLYVDDLPTLVWTGRSRKSDTNVASFLVPHLTRGALRIIGECTAERLEATRAECPAFFARFQVIQIPELDARLTWMVLQRAVRAAEKLRDVAIDPLVIETCQRLTARFQANRCEPGRSAELLRSVLASSRGSVKKTVRMRRRILRSDVISHFAHQTGLPAFVLWEEEARRAEDVTAWFDARVLAQPAATAVVTDIVSTLQQGLNDPERPLATALLVGPTGVGKTETAKALTEYLFGDAKRLLRFDMSELRGPAAIRRLIGGAGNPSGELTRKVAQQPFCVLLFDEIEKADPAVFDTLLQVLGEGRLTDARGRTTDFTAAVILLTSNLGVAEATRRLGFGDESSGAQDRHFEAAAQAFFRPEFYNRIDRIVPFRTLSREDVAPLVQRLIAQLLRRRGLARTGAVVRVDPRVVEHIIEKGFDPTFGARALKRTLERALTVPLARQMVRQQLGERVLVHADVRAGELDLRAWYLGDPPSPPTPLAPPEDATEVRALFTATAAALHDLTTSEPWQRVLDLRTELLRALQEPGIVDDDRLHLGDELAHERDQLAEALDDFAQDHLESFQYAEMFEKISVRRYRPHRRKHWEATTIELHRLVPIPSSLGRDPKRAAANLNDLALRTAALRFRTDGLENPRDFFLCIEPETADRDGLTWAGAITEALKTAFGEWGICRELWRLDQGWTGQTGFYGMPDEDTGEPEEVPVPAAHALWFRGPDMAALLAAEVGAHIRIRDGVRGRDVQMCITTALEAPASEDTVGACVALLDERDRARIALREAWRAGEVADSELPPPPGVVRILRPQVANPKLSDELRGAALARIIRGEV